MATQPLFDMSKAQPVQGAPLFDMTKAQAVGAPSVQQPDKPGAWQAFAQGVGLPSSMKELQSMQAEQDAHPVTSVLKNLPPVLAARIAVNYLKTAAKGWQDAAQQGTEAGQQYAEGVPAHLVAGKIADAALHGALNSVPFAGPSVEAGGQYFSEGNYRAAFGSGLAALLQVEGGNLAGGAANVAGKVADAAPGIAKAAAGVGGKVLSAVGDSANPDLVGLASPRAAHALRLASKTGSTLTDLADRVPAKVDTAMTAGEKAAFMQESEARATAVGERNAQLTAAEAPAAQAPQLTPLQNFQQRIAGRQQPATPARVPMWQQAGIEAGKPPVATMAAEQPAITAEATQLTPLQKLQQRLAARQPAQLPAAFTPTAERPPTYQPPPGSATNPSQNVTAPAAPTILEKLAAPAEVQKMLDESLGGKPLQRNVPLRQQIPVPASEGSPAVALPKGFTPVDSSALSGYKYDAGAKEFESITKGGQHYIFGEVSPEEAAAFEAADSKGKAWQLIRNNTLVAKVINGKRVPIAKSGAQASFDAR